ncbi:MAG: enoyl-CoA hydratase/isomerase family protein [Ahrensia sp.]|nr:enoyl-CoA hydratase/isomerase family protein [Ahrensia sp.]
MDLIRLDKTGPVAELAINRPQKRNALDANMVDTLHEHVVAIDRDDDIHVVILTGTEGNFCAGGDIAAWSGESPDAFGQHWVRNGHIAFDALARLRQPVIAALNGHTLGGGLELAACADYRIAERHIKLGQPETGLGIIPGWSGTQRAVHRFGAQIVRRMAVFGEVFTAEEALAHGLVDHVVDAGTSFEAAHELAKRVLSRAPLATKLAKMMINSADGEEQGRVVEALAGSVAAANEELREGLRAFREKRAPNFFGETQ